MRNIWTIAKREYVNYFNSSIAYAIAFFIFIFLGGYFTAYVMFLSSSSGLMMDAPDAWQVTGGLLATLLVFSSPFLTMRLLADEARMGTMELLLTVPLRDYELVVGKWLGAFLFVLTLIAITLVFPFMLDQLVTPGIDQILMLSGYLGLVLMAAAFLAIGVGISAIFDNQFAAAFVTLLALLFLWWLVGLPSFILTSGGEIFRYLSVGSHIQDNFATGSLNIYNIVYLLSLTGLGIAVGTTAVEIRRWR